MRPGEWQQERDEYAAGWLEHEMQRVEWESDRNEALGLDIATIVDAGLEAVLKAERVFRNLEAIEIEHAKAQDFRFSDFRDAS